MPRGIARYSGQSARTVADLLARGGEAQAQAALASGDAWGRGIANAGYALGQGIQQYGQIKEQEKEKQQADTQRAEANGKFAALVPHMSKMEPQEFVARTMEIYGPEGIEVAQGMYGIQRLQYDIAAAKQAAQAGQREEAAAAAAQVEEDMRNAARGIDVVGGPNDPLGRMALDEVTPMIADFYQNPQITPDWVAENWEQVRRDLLPPEQIKAGKGDRIMERDPVTGEVREVVGPVEEGPGPGTLEAYIVGKYGPQATPEQQLQARREFEAAGRAPQAPAPPAPLAAAPAEWRNVVERATLSDPKVGQAAAPIVERLLEAGDVEQAREVTMQAAIDSEPTAERGLIVTRRGLIGALDDIEAGLKALEKKGIDTGPIRAGWEGLQRIAGSTTDPDVARIINQLETTRQNYRRGMSGAAFSAPESAEYGQIVPNFKNELPTNLALIEGLRASMASYDREFWNRKVGKKGVELLGIQLDPPQRGQAEVPAALPQDGGGYDVGMVVEDEAGNQFQWTGSGWIKR